MAPRRQAELASLLTNATESVTQQLDGSVSASIHSNADGKKIVNYAQWKSEEKFEAMKENPKAVNHMEKAAELANSFDPIVCTVLSSHHRMKWLFYDKSLSHYCIRRSR